MKQLLRHPWLLKGKKDLKEIDPSSTMGSKDNLNPVVVSEMYAYITCHPVCLRACKAYQMGSADLWVTCSLRPGAFSFFSMFSIEFMGRLKHKSPDLEMCATQISFSQECLGHGHFKITTFNVNIFKFVFLHCAMLKGAKCKWHILKNRRPFHRTALCQSHTIVSSLVSL